MRFEVYTAKDGGSVVKFGECEFRRGTVELRRNAARTFNPPQPGRVMLYCDGELESVGIHMK